MGAYTLTCHCGGTMEQKAAKGDRIFYGCSNFRRTGCGQTLNPLDYERYQEQGITQLPKTAMKDRAPRTKANHRSYLPAPKRNTITQLKFIPHRQMTDEQEALINAGIMPGVRVGGNADAGVGKTSLLIQLAARSPRMPREITTGAIVAFNARPSKELMHKLPENWVSPTLHSCGNDACSAAYGTNPYKPNEYKTKDIIEAEYGKPQHDEDRYIYSVVQHIVSMCKALAFDEVVPDETIIERATYYNRDVSQDPGRVCSMVKFVLKVSRSLEGIQKHGHDFDDMIWLPVINKLPVAQYRYVAVDEGQDLNICRMRLALMMLLPGSTLIVVGDKDQAIYGFTCADTQALATFDEMVGFEWFPITINWRCPSRIIELTQIIHPSIKARPGAPLGAIHEIANTEQNPELLDILVTGDVVLCRTNAPLIRTAYQLIKIGVGAKVLGRDIGENIRKLVVKLGNDGQQNGQIKFCSTKELIRRAGDWYNAQAEILEAKQLRNPDAEFQKLNDTYESVLAIIGVEIDEHTSTLRSVGIPTVEGVLQKIALMFGEEGDFDPKKVVVLSTVHKFKGGQNDRIFILDAADLHPHPMASSDWEVEQELCVLYVAITRCGDGTNNPRQALFFVNGLPTPLEAGRHLLTPYEGVRRA